jgi:hypothetical protein
LPELFRDLQFFERYLISLLTFVLCVQGFGCFYPSHFSYTELKLFQKKNQEEFIAVLGPQL